MAPFFSFWDFWGPILAPFFYPNPTQPGPAECAKRLNPPRACRSCVSDNPERSTERPSLVKLCFTSLTLGAFSHDRQNTAHASKINENVGFPMAPQVPPIRRRRPPWRTPVASILLAYAVFSVLLPQTCLLFATFASKLPAGASKLPAKLSKLPPKASKLPAKLSKVPAKASKTACQGLKAACWEA